MNTSFLNIHTVKFFHLTLKIDNDVGKRKNETLETEAMLSHVKKTYDLLRVIPNGLF